MMQTPPTPYDPPPQPQVSLRGVLVFPALLFVFVAALASPLLTAAALVGIAAARAGVRRGIHRIAHQTRSLTLPGVGTVEYRVTPR